MKRKTGMIFDFAAAFFRNYFLTEGRGEIKYIFSIATTLSNSDDGEKKKKLIEN